MTARKNAPDGNLGHLTFLTICSVGGFGSKFLMLDEDCDYDEKGNRENNANHSNHPKF